MGTYRSVAARMGNAKQSTQGKLDSKLEKLGERISERLGELTDMERMALDCWKNGITQGTYEVDHQALTEKPYVSIRKVVRFIEEYDVAERRTLLREAKANERNITEEDKARLRSRINELNEGL